MKKIFLVLLSIMLITSNLVLADDIDIYGISTIDVKPNVLLVFDNSGSMGSTVQVVSGEKYDPDVTYSSWNNFVSKRAYYQNGNFFSSVRIDDANWRCSDARDDLEKKGYWRGEIRKRWRNGQERVVCGGNTSEYRSGNYLNFLRSVGQPVTRTRMEVAKEVIAELVYENQDIRFGLMKFNTNGGADDGGYIVTPCDENNLSTLIGSFKTGNSMTRYSNSTYGKIGELTASTWTPLAETLAEAGLYFSGNKSWFNGTRSSGFPVGDYSYNCTANSSSSSCGDYGSSFLVPDSSSPIQYRCQKNYIIVITDGAPTRDDHSNLRYKEYILDGVKIPGNANPDNSGSYMDDVSAVLYDNDLLPLPLGATDKQILKFGKTGDFEKQNVTTHVIGFTIGLDILESTATNGGGSYYTADDLSTLSEALDNILSTIRDDNDSFVAASVPVSKANEAYAGNFVYYGLFQPTVQGNWIGNLKKYGITDSGVIKDNSTPPINAISNGAVLNGAKSYWSTTQDGPTVSQGGAGAVMSALIDGGNWNRSIYTYTVGSNTDLTDTRNAFTTTNSTLKTQYNNLTDDIIKAVRAEDGEWPLRSILHSQPTVLHYDTDNDGKDDESTIYVGSNGGMLHAFDDKTGIENWAFVPPDLVADFDDFNTADSLQYYVDGAITVATVAVSGRDREMLLFGERRGGFGYTALDVTGRATPMYLYSIDSDFLGSGTENLGQSWGEPKKIRLVTAKKTESTPTQTVDGFLLPGGYDTNQDRGQDGGVDKPNATDSMGRALFAFERYSGNLIDKFKFYHSLDTSDDSAMPFTHSMIAANGFENPRSRNTTRIYAADLYGNMWAFRDDIYHHNKSGKDVDAVKYGAVDYEEDGAFTQKIKLFSTPSQKIFYEPSLTSEYYSVPIQFPSSLISETQPEWELQKRIGDYIFYGTGDRAFPERMDLKNSFYALKNPWRWRATNGSGDEVGTETPNIIKAYIDTADGSVKKIDVTVGADGKVTQTKTNVVIVGKQRDDDGAFIDGVEASTYFILDNTENLYQNGNTDKEIRIRLTNYAKDALQHSKNAGWYIDLLGSNGSLAGEKVVSTPTLYAGGLYFTTYVPEPQGGNVDNSDPCANPGASGKGRLYSLDYKTGGALIDNDKSTSGIRGHTDRYNDLDGKGIPPGQALVVHEGKPTIVVGYETLDPADQSGIESYYWRQLQR